MSAEMKKNSRECIVAILLQIEKEHTYVQLALKDALGSVAPIDRGFCTEVVTGTIKYKMRIDYVINQYAKVKVQKMKPFIRNLMRMSVYQLLFLEKVPASAVINEAVKLVHKRKMSNLSGFVNGLLRTIEREKANLAYPSLDTVEGISVYYSFPVWIVTEWVTAYGLEDAKKIAEAMNERAQVSVRVNTCKTTKEALTQALLTEGMQVQDAHWLAEGLVVQGSSDIATSKSFLAGEWTVQDESAMLVGPVVAPQKGDVVLDLCSAPGGKSTHLAQLMENQGEVISTDVHAHKMALIEKNAARMGFDCITPVLQDGLVQRADWIGKFDRVLLDAPCSGLGIMKRKPDIRYAKQPEDIVAIEALQKQLLCNAVDYLKPGGVLVYSTCTIGEKENEAVVRYGITELGLELDNIRDYLPKSLQSYVVADGMIQILPYYQGTDGFFIARLRKKR